MNERVLPHKLFSIKSWKDAFILDRRMRSLSCKTIDYYQRQLDDFERFALSNNISLVPEISVDLLRAYVSHLEDKGHKLGGIHTTFRALGVFLRWYRNQTELKDWQNPIKKVKLPEKPGSPNVSEIIVDIEAVIATCKANFRGIRDKAMMLCLLDVAGEAEEFLNIDLMDMDLTSGRVVIRQRNKKQRTVFISEKSRQAIGDYLRFRPDNLPALWVNSSGKRLTVLGLQTMLRERGKMAGVNPPSVNDFKRASKQIYSIV